MSSVISVENLGKKYFLNHKRQESYLALRDILTDGVKRAGLRLLGRGEPRCPGDREEFWALKNLSFEVQQGDRIGIIGRNGAGKSTLLKILSRITEPSTGSVRIRGRVSSLLEVGTGFHPELTGRENIFLNGAIMGMGRAEIKRNFDEIVAFAEVERFLDTPVKRYSSGMYVRLAFAVAAHLEPEILVVDEVLAVGDVAFQKKCLAKMRAVGKEGRTILFVSHNMVAISQLCDKALVLKDGELLELSPVEQAVGRYLADTEVQTATEWKGDAGNETVRLTRTWVAPAREGGAFKTSSELEIGIEVEILKAVDGLVLGFKLLSQYEDQLAYLLHDDQDESPLRTVAPQKMVRRFIVPANALTFGKYRIEFDVGVHMKGRIISEEGALSFSLENYDGIGRRFPVPEKRGFSSLFRPDWKVIAG